MALYPITNVIRSLHAIGVARHGERYQRSVAADLSEVSGHKVTPMQVGRWTMGTRQGPHWLPIAVIRLAHRYLDEIQDRQVRIRREILSLDAGGHPNAFAPGEREALEAGEWEAFAANQEAEEPDDV
jgi:hypothetical protein